MTKIWTRTQITNTPATPVAIGQSFGSWSRQVTTPHWVNCCPLLSRRPGFQVVAGTLRSIKWLRDGSFLVECARKSQAMGLLKTTWFVDRPVRVSIHKALNMSRGVIRCCELSSMTEMEIRMKLQEHGVVEVHRVTVKRDIEKVPTNTLFLTFNTPDLTKEITVGYLKVKVALFVPNPMRCFSCNKFGHMSQGCWEVYGLWKR